MAYLHGRLGATYANVGNPGFVADFTNSILSTTGLEHSEVGW
jgi:hypothetical protein